MLAPELPSFSIGFLPKREQHLHYKHILHVVLLLYGGYWYTRGSCKCKNNGGKQGDITTDIVSGIGGTDNGSVVLLGHFSTN
jgi:hypothetical protein